MVRKRQIVVIGLGRFGTSLVRALVDLGHEVLCIDRNMKVVQDVAEYATQAVQADATDEDNLRQLGIDDFGAAVVGIGTDLQSSILVTMNLKRLGVPLVVCKAQNEQHGEILTKLGADRVVYPERDTATRLAHSFAFSLAISDYIEVSPSYGIVMLNVPASMVGRTLDEVDFRGRYGVTVLLLRAKDRVILNPSRNERLGEGDVMVVAGDEAKLDDIQSA